MSQGKKILLAIVTVLPLMITCIYAVTFMNFFFNMVSNHMESMEQNPFFFMHTMAPLFLLIGAASLIGIGLLIYYIIHASKNPKFDSTQRLMWILIIVFTHTIGQIVYFILEIWPDKPEHTS